MSLCKVAVTSVLRGLTKSRTTCFFYFFIFFFYFALQPPVSQSLLIHEVSRSHTTTDHSRQVSSGRVMSSSQRLLPDSTQHSQHTEIHSPPLWDSNPDLNRREAANPRLRPRGYWDRQVYRYQVIITSVPRPVSSQCEGSDLYIHLSSAFNLVRL